MGVASTQLTLPATWAAVPTAEVGKVPCMYPSFNNTSTGATVSCLLATHHLMIGRPPDMVTTFRDRFDLLFSNHRVFQFTC
jgi:hypothetical protein